MEIGAKKKHGRTGESNKPSLCPFALTQTEQNLSPIKKETKDISKPASAGEIVRMMMA